MLYFIAAVYNEEHEINDLIKHVSPLVDGYRIVDDESTDDTERLLYLAQAESWATEKIVYGDFDYKTIPHTGLPETVKNEALKMVPDGSWVLMLDADERFAPGVLSTIKQWLTSPEAEEVDYVYFTQYEIIDGEHVRTFQKSKLFRKSAITFPTGIHEDDRFEGRGIAKDEWIVLHRKSTAKQITRETEYVNTYKQLLEEGKIDEGRYKWLLGLHHYIRA